MADSSMQKRVKSSDNVDMISALPDDILCHILSFLPLKEAVGTSIVSTRWRYLFASLPDISLQFSPAPKPTELRYVLSFADPKFEAYNMANDRRISNYVNFGNRIFRLRNGTPLRKFDIMFRTTLPYRFRLAFDKWISAAVLCKVEELTIPLGCSLTSDTILSTIFTCKTLVSLKIYNNEEVSLNGEISLPLLKVLHLNVKLSEHGVPIRGLVQGSPFLEELNLVIISKCKTVSDQLSRSGIFRCKKLVALRLILLYRCTSFLPDLFCLPNLKALYLGSFTFVGEDALQKRLLESCPLLEELVLERCYFVSHNHRDHEAIGVYSSSLKHLRLRGDYARENMCTFEIDSTSLQSLVYQHQSDKIFVNAPNLRYFDYAGDAQRVSINQGLASPITSARISVESMSMERTESSSSRVQLAFELINYLQCAKSLCLSDLTLEALYHCQDPLPTFKNMTSLRIIIKRQKRPFDPTRWWKMFARFFAGAPNLELLVLRGVLWNNYERDEEFEHLLPLALPVYIVEQLREIKIEVFRELESDFTLVEYILQNSKALNKMTVGAPWSFSPSESCKQRILSFKKCSQDCQIIFVCNEDLYDESESEGAKTYWSSY